MTPEDQTEYCEIICNAFTETEIEQLEIFANYWYGIIDWVDVELPKDLILDTLAAYGDDECA